jgi:hypothetical protein
MGTLTKTNTFTSGTPAVASEVNVNFDEIINEINGNIDAINLGTAAVTNTKIGTGAVSNIKLASNAVTDIKVDPAAAIDASKIADGSVSNAEFQRLDGVTSDIQGQINALVPNTGNIYVGTISGGVSLLNGPAGWTISKPVTGSYELTHNLGHTDYVVLATISSIQSEAVSVSSWGNNTIDFKTFDTTDGSADDAVIFFMVIDIS